MTASIPTMRKDDGEHFLIGKQKKQIVMVKKLKQCVGIDCSMQTLDCTLSYLKDDLEIEQKAYIVFKNDEAGFKQLVKWAGKHATANVLLQFVVEATGVYHQRAASYLVDHGCKVSVVLPSRAKYFAQTLSIKTVNDKISSKTISILGLEKKLDNWQKPDEVYHAMKQLTREREDLILEGGQIKNQLHAQEHGAWPHAQTIKRMNQRLRLLEKQIDAIESDIKQLATSKPELNERIKNICSIKGVGLITAVTVIAETDGFSLIRNQRQLVSYAGLDVIEKQSGISIKTKSRISHKGNNHLRKALYFPSLSAISKNEFIRPWYEKMLSRHQIKMKSIVAVQRKLLILIYTLWKKNESYNPPSIKYLEQPHVTALTELNLIRS